MEPTIAPSIKSIPAGQPQASQPAAAAMGPYSSRVCTPEQAAARIASRTRVFLSGNCAVPQRVLAALVARAPELAEVEIVQVLTVGSAEYVAPEMAGHLRVNTLFISDNVRAAVNAGRADFTPCLLSEIPDLFTSGRLPIDVALIQVAPPDEHGFCSFGVEVGVTKPAAHTARLVIAEINPYMPRTLGDSFIHISRIDVIVPVELPAARAKYGRHRPGHGAHRRTRGRADPQRRHPSDRHRRHPQRGAALPHAIIATSAFIPSSFRTAWSTWWSGA